MGNYYATVSFLIPASKESIEANGFTLVPRRWDVSIFSWAYLSTNSPHHLFMPYQLADVLSSRVNLEFAVEADEFESAKEQFDLLYIGLVTHGVLPYSAPLISTHSLNSLSGLGEPAESIQDDRAEMRGCLRRGEQKVEVRWYRPSLDVFGTGASATPEIDASTFEGATRDARAWGEFTRQHRQAHAIVRALAAAPAVNPPDQGLLLMWTALESLFPEVRTELRFRLSLYLAQLIAPRSQRSSRAKEIRRMYDVRCDIAHGSKSDNSQQDWADVWTLLVEVSTALLKRGSIPSETDLLDELLADSQ